MHVKCLAQSLAHNSEITFSLPSLNGKNSNQMNIKDSGCRLHVHIVSERTFEITLKMFVHYQIVEY